MKVESGLKPRVRGAGNMTTVAGLKPRSALAVMGEAETSLSKHRHLPHIDLVGHYQFITFRTFDSVDDFVKKLSTGAQSNAKKQLAVDAYLDQSPKGAYLTGEVLDFLSAFLKSKDGVLYELVAFAMMSNHVHLLIKPMAGLSQVMQAIKGVSARTINTMLGKTGKFWADDYYDKLIRDERHFAVVYEYIKNNPLKIQNEGQGFSSAEIVVDTFGAEAPIPRGGLIESDRAEAPIPRCELAGVDGAKAPTPTRFYGKFEFEAKEVL